MMATLAAATAAALAVPQTSRADSDPFAAENEAAHGLHLKSCEVYMTRDAYADALRTLVGAERAFLEGPQSSSDRRDLDWARARAAQAAKSFLGAREVFNRAYRQMAADGYSVFIFEGAYMEFQTPVVANRGEHASATRARESEPELERGMHP